MGKRLFDLFFSGFGLIVIAPVLGVLALLVWLEDRGPVFYRQIRVGLHGKPFRIWKFRSMVLNADRQGLPLTVGRDPRITRVGSVLRQTKLDEIPQLLNVLVGEMSFVGPRPEVQKYVDLYSLEQRQVLELIPGITDLASIKYRAESELLAASSAPEQTYIDEIMPAKIRLNLEYAQGSHVISDVLVILRTLVRVMT
jgi:lipopolysaccharide/colanic/teichoic acid biosynthesis glycosyltransferase